MRLNTKHPMYRRCYVVHEALYHMLGGKASGLKVKQYTHEFVSHWWLQAADGGIIDLTIGQFYDTFPYHKGRTTSFLTKKMSKRTKAFLAGRQP